MVATNLEVPGLMLRDSPRKGVGGPRLFLPLADSLLIPITQYIAGTQYPQRAGP